MDCSNATDRLEFAMSSKKRLTPFSGYFTCSHREMKFWEPGFQSYFFISLLFCSLTLTNYYYFFMIFSKRLINQNKNCYFERSIASVVVT